MRMESVAPAAANLKSATDFGSVFHHAGLSVAGSRILLSTLATRRKKQTSYKTNIIQRAGQRR